MTTPSSDRVRAYKRFIPSEEIGEVSQWRFGAVDEAELRAAELAAAQIAAAQDEGAAQERYEKAWQEGYAEGLAQGQAEATAQAQQRMQEYQANEGRETAERLAALVQSLDARLQEAEQRIASGVLEIACSLARQVVRQELAGNPNALQPVVREALGMLLTDGRSAVVRLNPADMEVVEQPLREEFASLSLNWLADASVPPGGCLVESAGAVVDGSLQKRWTRAVANLGLKEEWDAPDPVVDAAAPVSARPESAASQEVRNEEVRDEVVRDEEPGDQEPGDAL